MKFKEHHTVNKAYISITLKMPLCGNCNCIKNNNFVHGMQHIFLLLTYMYIVLSLYVMGYIKVITQIDT